MVRYAYKRVTDAPLPSVVPAVTDSAARRGFVVLESHDIQAALAAKGFHIRPLVIVEFGPAAGDKELAAKLARMALELDPCCFRK